MTFLSSSHHTAATKSVVITLMLVGGLFSSSILVITLVLLQILVFLYYDCLVQRQERLLHSKEGRKLDCSERIVQELFPEPVRRRLSEQRRYEDNSAEPLLDTYKEATVLFADISNYTKWSSGRDPRQVFALLETLYAKFDELAVLHGVTKIETIGDCFLAVTGCPVADDEHALHMAEFADAILQASDEVLTNACSDSSCCLQLRVGIHSGEVVAGVLRNHKARYQLFGDCINVAARIESTGIAGSIQISQATADFLRQSGKAHWLHKRQDTVYAKGKGRISTYWLDVSKECIPLQQEEEVSTTSSVRHHHHHHQQQQVNKEHIVLVQPMPLRSKSSKTLSHRPTIPARNLRLTSVSRARSEGYL